MKKQIFSILFFSAFLLTNAQVMQVVSDLSVGETNSKQTGYGSRLHLRGLNDAGVDSVWISRYNNATNQTELRVNVGDDNSGDDRFVVGSTPGGTSWNPFFTVLNNGKVGIGSNTPTSMLDVQAQNGDGIRIGKIGDAGNLNVAIGSLTAQYNLDFTGYRDVSLNQIGARISALRFNCYQDNNALIQKTGLAFSTNPSGGNTGATDLVERMRITPEGFVGIGVKIPQHNLDVKGTICADEVLVKTVDWADFVFDKDYKLRDLKEVDQYIQEHGRLPEIPSTAEVKEKGVNIVEVQAKLLQKLEELTLYTIQLKKEIEQLKAAKK